MYIYIAALNWLNKFPASHQNYNSEDSLEEATQLIWNMHYLYIHQISHLLEEGIRQDISSLLIPLIFY